MTVVYMSLPPWKCWWLHLRTLPIKNVYKGLTLRVCSYRGLRPKTGVNWIAYGLAQITEENTCHRPTAPSAAG